MVPDHARSSRARPQGISTTPHSSDASASAEPQTTSYSPCRRTIAVVLSLSLIDAPAAAPLVPKVDGVTTAPTTIPKRLGAGMECWVESFPWNDDERIAIFEPVRRGWELRRKGNLAQEQIRPGEILTQAVGRDKFLERRRLTQLEPHWG